MQKKEDGGQNLFVLPPRLFPLFGEPTSGPSDLHGRKRNISDGFVSVE